MHRNTWRAASAPLIVAKMVVGHENVKPSTVVKCGSGLSLARFWTIKRINCQFIPWLVVQRGQALAAFCKLQVVAGGGRIRKNRVVVVSLCAVSTTVPWSPSSRIFQPLSVSASRFVGLDTSL
ncbi:hypothetical protein KCU81_g452, partial [Aureobasidium melanogenum]